MNFSTFKSSRHVRTPAFLMICLLGTSIGWAAPPATRSVEVTFRDLDLSTKSDAARLYYRIQAAARRVCQYEPTSPRATSTWQYCVRPTVDSAVVEVNSPLLTQLHSRQGSPAVTAMNK